MLISAAVSLATSAPIAFGPENHLVKGASFLPLDKDIKNAEAQFLGGYASRLSVAQGDLIDFHISTDVPLFDLIIWREGPSRRLMTTIIGLNGGEYDCTAGYATGCGWPVASTFQIPLDWPSGIYTVDIPTAVNTQHIIFWVRQV